MKKWLAIGLAFGCGVVLAASQPADSPLDNRRVLDQLRLHHPELYAGLLQKFDKFQQLPAEEQERLRALSRAIAAEPSATQYRFERAAERYAVWYDSLSVNERDLIDNASSPEARLERIRALRRRQYVTDLPAPRRDKLRGHKGFEYLTLLNQFRAEDQKSARDWEQALRHWDELCREGVRARPIDFEQPVQDFVQQQLVPRLTRDEREKLRTAEGLWPGYPAALVALVDQNTFKLLLPESGKSRLEDLPADLQKQLNVKVKPGVLKRRLNPLVGRWPEFALAVAETAESNSIKHAPLGPSRPGEFAPPIADFIQNRLLAPASPLERDERARLSAAEGNWPQYPYLLAELIKKHNLEVPGVTLPKSWDRYRERPRQPDPSIVPDQTLRYFALLELTPQQREELRVSLTDPAGRGRLQQEYIKSYPREWRTLQLNDELKRQRTRLDP